MGCACAGMMEQSYQSGWRDLPYDLMNEILRKLPMGDLARVATTCRSFNSSFAQLLEKQQKARCDLALAHFGQERITAFVALISNWLNGDTVSQTVVRYMLECFGISPDGKVYVVGTGRVRQSDQVLCETRDIRIETSQDWPEVCVKISWVYQSTARSSICLRFDYYRYIDENVAIIVDPCANEDVHGLALAQVLASKALALPFRVGGRTMRIQVRWGSDPSRHFTGTDVGLHHLIGPLLPLASEYNSACNTDMGWIFVRRRPNLQGVTTAKNRIMMSVTHTMSREDWTALPPDIVDRMWNRLSLVHLARRAPTCTALRGALWRRLGTACRDIRLGRNLVARQIRLFGGDTSIDWEVVRTGLDAWHIVLQ